MRVKMEWRALREQERRLWAAELLVRRPAREFTGFQQPVFLRRSFLGGDSDSSLPFWNPLTGLLAAGYRAAVWSPNAELLYYQHARFGYWSPDGWRLLFGKKPPLRNAYQTSDRMVVLDGKRSAALMLTFDLQANRAMTFHPTESLVQVGRGVFSFHNLEAPELELVWPSNLELLWSPDRTHCLEQVNPAQFVLRDISGTELWHSPDLTDQDVNWRSMQWSPDGQRVHCAGHRQITVFDFSALPPDIARYPLSPNQIHDDYFGGITNAHELHWTANGAYLVFATAHQIHFTPQVARIPTRCNRLILAIFQCLRRILICH